MTDVDLARRFVRVARLLVPTCEQRTVTGILWRYTGTNELLPVLDDAPTFWMALCHIMHCTNRAVGLHTFHDATYALIGSMLDAVEESAEREGPVFPVKP